MQHTYTYPGVALHSDLEQGKAPGQITLDFHSLKFRYDDKEIEFSIHNLVITNGGSSNQLVFLTHPDYPGWQIYTGKKVILKDLKRLSTPQVAHQVSAIHSKWMKFRLLVAVILVTLALLIFGLFQLRKPLTKAVARAIPIEMEETLGQTVFEQYRAGKIIIKDEETKAALLSMAAPLLDSIDSSRYDFKIYIIKDDTINAFALPGGYMIFNTGLLESAESSEEILGVMAHEISHVTEQHGIRKLMDQIGFMLLLNAFFGDLGGMWAQVIEGGRFLVNQQFSRSFEKEADILGFKYLVNAKINPAGMTSFFTRLYEAEREAGQVENDGVNTALTLLSTHPASEQRIKYLQKQLEKLEHQGDYHSLDSEYNQLKNALSNELNRL